MCALWTETLSPAIYSGPQGVVKQAWPKAALVYNTIFRILMVLGCSVLSAVRMLLRVGENF